MCEKLITDSPQGPWPLNFEAVEPPRCGLVSRRPQLRREQATHPFTCRILTRDGFTGVTGRRTTEQHDGHALGPIYLLVGLFGPRVRHERVVRSLRKGEKSSTAVEVGEVRDATDETCLSLPLWLCHGVTNSFPLFLSSFFLSILPSFFLPLSSALFDLPSSSAPRAWQRAQADDPQVARYYFLRSCIQLRNTAGVRFAYLP